MYGRSLRKHRLQNLYLPLCICRHYVVVTLILLKAELPFSVVFVYSIVHESYLNNRWMYSDESFRDIRPRIWHELVRFWRISGEESWSDSCTDPAPSENMETEKRRTIIFRTMKIGRNKIEVGKKKEVEESLNEIAKTLRFIRVTLSNNQSKGNSQIKGLAAIYATQSLKTSK